MQSDAGHLETFQAVLKDNPAVFHTCRTATSLHHHWVLMGHYNLLNDQKGICVGIHMCMDVLVWVGVATCMGGFEKYTCVDGFAGVTVHVYIVVLVWHVYRLMLVWVGGVEGYTFV